MEYPFPPGKCLCQYLAFDILSGGGSTMLRHIVLFKWKPDTSPEQIQETEAGFAGMRDSIKVVRSMHFGPDLDLMEGTYDYAMVADFDSEADWRSYRDHPDHIAFFQRFGHLAAGVARVQFEFD
jgi:hypothetical protein